MSKFKQKGKRTVPNPPSGSLSDIVFMLLFFFMVTTTMRETESKVQLRLPEASEIAKLERKDLTSYINIGTPTRNLQAQFGTESRIQLNDSFKTTAEIRDNDYDYFDSQMILQDIAYYPLGHPSSALDGVRFGEKGRSSVAGILASLLTQASEGED